jgi:peptide/nickel transport system permease protein
VSIWKNKQLRGALWILGFVLALAAGRDILANGRPLYCRIGGVSYFPGLRTVFSDPNRPYPTPLLDSIRINYLWKTYPFESAVFAPVPFTPGEYLDRPTCPTAPPGTIHPGLKGSFRHWLGTDDVGRDMAAGIIGGARVAVMTGVFSMLISLTLGLFLGAMAGFYGDNRLRVKRGNWWLGLTGMLFSAWYAFVFLAPFIHADQTGTAAITSFALFMGILIAFVLLGRLVSRFPFGAKAIVIPIDLIVMRVVEVFDSTPKLILIIAIATLVSGSHSIWFIILLIGMLSWSGVAQFVRAELLRVREMDYISAARGMGLTEARILWRHAVPNAIVSTLLFCAFGVSGAIMLEATLSFLGIGGEGLRGISWGSLVYSARITSLRYWWIAIPPGIMIFLTIFALTTLGEGVNRRK